MKYKLLICIFTIFITQLTITAEEGLFSPEQVVVPFNKERVLKSIVRISTHIYWDVMVFERKEDADIFRQSYRAYPGSGRKTYLPEGVILWHVILTKADLAEISADPAQRQRPGFFEIVQAFSNVTKFPTNKIVPAEGHATGFFISQSGLILTNYHILREEIEATNRTMGSSNEITCHYTSFEVPIVESGRIIGWQPLNGVKLIRNLSDQDWQAGYDGVLLKVDTTPQAFLQIADRQPEPKEELWHFGFPMRTNRNAEQLKAIGYTDANDTLRVSRGKITEVKDHNFVSDADSFSGNSGSPALSRDGRVLGYLWDVFPDTEADRRATVFQGGSIYVTALPIGKRLQIPQ
ncbi:MAG: serine protease [Acidobacteriota bacterium]